jgi:acyl-CoA synthetase (AMP-forming)/AMP-acid ligase II
MIESRRLLEIADVQMHVAEDGAGRHAVPRLSFRRLDESGEVERSRDHVQLPVGARPPGVTRAIGIHLDTESIGIGEVERLADRVVRAAGSAPHRAEMSEKPAECRALRHQDGKVEQAQKPAARNGPDAATFAQPNEGSSAGGESRLTHRLLHHGETQDLLVIRQRARKVGNLQRYGPQTCFRRQPKGRRRDAEVLHMASDNRSCAKMRPMETPLTPLEFARRARRLYGRREAVVDGTVRLNYDEFFQRCDRWSAALQRLGIHQGDRVAYIAANTHRQLESFYAVPAIGAVLVPINFRLTPGDFAYILNHSGARVVCADPEFLDAVDGIRRELTAVERFISLGRSGDAQRATGEWLDYESLLAEGPASFVSPAVSESDLLTINYTSGTTSRPKGVMITHRNAYMNVVGTLIHVPMTCADRYLWTLPMFHANGWTFTWTVTAAGGTHVCLPKIDPRRVFELIDEERITLLCAAPTVLIGLANAPDDVRRRAPRGVRVITAGAPPAAATIQRVEGEFGWTLTQVYGLTETAPFITVCEPRPEHGGLSPEERATVKARQGVELITSGELLVVDEEGREVMHDGRTLGEIVVRGNVVMDGYYNDPHATAAALRGGWFHSGDAAVVHPDGYVEIRDRFKDVIISGGENISSVEVEGVLLRHPAVLEAAVVGVPDERWGEAPHGFVVLKPGEQTTEEALRAFARDRLAHFKVPRGFTFVSELPKTATGKIQKYVLRGGRAAISAQ